MSGMFRRATRPLSMLPRRGAVTTGPIKPINDNFPLSSVKTMGPHGFMKGSYTIMSLKNPIVGPMYRPPWVVGGIHNPTIDPIRHFNMQDRFKTLTMTEWLKCFWYPLLPARVHLYMFMAPAVCVLIVTWLEQRREPMEIWIDREEYWKDYDTWYWGIYFDHHHFSHMLCHRRAHKWGYAGQDITLEGDDHGHGHH